MIKSLAVNIITHNGLDSFIREAINSVKDYCKEIVVLDDGSTDDTGFVLRVEFPEVKVLRRETSHTDERAMLLNDCKFETKSEWILRIDDDEIMPIDTMEEITNLDPQVPFYSLPFLHWEDDHFIGPPEHKRMYVARLFKNLPEVNWKQEKEVLAWRNTLISSKANQIALCGKLKNPFLHFGELKRNRYANYSFHTKGHCRSPLTEKYLSYVPKQN